jgi:hypothetical protein
MRIMVELDDEGLLAQRDHLAHGGMLVPIADPPPPMTDVLLAIVAPAGRVEIPARVVHDLGDGNVGIAVDDVDVARGRLEPLFARAEGGGGTREQPGNLQQRIHRMTADQKRELALTGDRVERLALLRDTNKLVHTFVMRNPNLSGDEVRLMAGMRNINPLVLEKIAQSPEWTRDQRIVAAVVGNPKTPTPIATRLLDKLAAGELRRLSKATDVPPAIQRVARRKLAR